MATGSKCADSNSTRLVVSLTWVSVPPIIPANATGPIGSAMTTSSGPRVCQVSSSSSSFSSSSARRAMIWPSLISLKSKACSGWPISQTT